MKNLDKMKMLVTSVKEGDHVSKPVGSYEHVGMSVPEDGVMLKMSGTAIYIRKKDLETIMGVAGDPRGDSVLIDPWRIEK